MQTVEIVLNKFISRRMQKSKIKINKEISFDEFNDLLDFDKNELNVYLKYKKDSENYKGEAFVLSKINFLKNKESVLEIKTNEIKINDKQEEVKIEGNSDSQNLIIKEGRKEEKKRIEKDEKIDFSMFDALLEEFNPESKKTKKRFFKQNKETSKKIINYFKKEIRYYEKKIDTIYKLDNLENEEKNLFELKKRLDKLKEDYELLQQNILVAEKFESLTKTCQKEIISLEKIIQSNDLKQINDEVDYNLKQEEFENLLKGMDLKINSNICFNMLKRMMFNLYKMSVGMYTIEISKEDYKKLVYGSYLVVNSVIGIREAISLKFNKSRYYNQTDYNNLSEDELIDLSNDLLNQTIINIEELKDEFKRNFSTYRKYTDEYEEVYFKIIRLKKILDKKQEELKELVEG